MPLLSSLAVVGLVLGVAGVQLFAPSWTATTLWCGSLLLVGTTIVSVKEGERAFGGSAVITLATLMVASQVMVKTPAYQRVCAKAHTLPVPALTFLSLVLSSVLNNIPVYLAVVPVLVTKHSPPWTFVHLAHACALGGLLTPLGTSSHFIANDLLEDFGKDRLTLKDFLTFTPLGVLFGYVGSLVLCYYLVPSVSKTPDIETPPPQPQPGPSPPPYQPPPQPDPSPPPYQPPPPPQRDPHSTWILPLLVLWIMASFLQNLLGTSQWVVSAALLALMLVLGLVDREKPWASFRGQTLVFTALSILVGTGVRESGLGDAILDGLDYFNSQWLATSLAVVLLTQVMHNSIIVSVFVPALLEAPTSVLVAVTALGSLSLCLAAGYPLNELVLAQTGLGPKTLVLPGLGVALLTLGGCFISHLLSK